MALARPPDRDYPGPPGPCRRRGRPPCRRPQHSPARPACHGSGQPDDARPGRDGLRVRGALRPRHHQIRIRLRDRRHPARHSDHRHGRLVPDPGRSKVNMPQSRAGGELSPAAAWSQRVRKVGGYIQLAFAAFWLIRGALNIGGAMGTALSGVALVLVVVVLVYAIRVTAGIGRRPTSPEAKAIERSVTVATIIELVASFVFPVIVIAAGHSDWVLPSIAITIGPLLLWLDHLVHIPRYRPVGWALTIGPVILVATMSGSALAATTGLTAGVLLLGTAAAGFHDLAGLRPGRMPKPALLSPQAL